MGPAGDSFYSSLVEVVGVPLGDTKYFSVAVRNHRKVKKKTTKEKRTPFCLYGLVSVLEKPGEGE